MPHAGGMDKEKRRGNTSPNRGSGHRDMNQIAFDTVQIATGEKPNLKKPGPKKRSGVSLRRHAGRG